MPAHAPPTTPALPAPAQRWDLFCRVIDNYGDLGVSLRLARELAGLGLQVRLWCDDLRALAWMQPTMPVGLACLPWNDSLGAEPAEVVIETFGCELPTAYVERMSTRGAHGGTPPIWINLEYLSAEPYVERSHGLRSPQLSGPGRGLDKWFFYPGFTSRTGGLLREAGLLQAAHAHDGLAWLAARGWAPAPGEQVLSLFAYPQAPLRELLRALDEQARPWLLLLCHGAPQQALPELLAELQAEGRGQHLRSLALPPLSQADYDRLLWSCDLNLVRGEDSFVRAQWAGQPFVWQIYAQDDGAHGAKLEAFLAAFEHAAPRHAAGGDWPALARAWNGLQAWSPQADLALARWPAQRDQARQWREHLASQLDLTQQLRAFVADKGAAPRPGLG